ncbi:MAG: hypothetical protein ACRD1J_05725 [Terriglobia bacterium]
MKCRRILGITLVSVMLLPACLLATQTSFWRMGSFENFLKGNLQAVSVSMNGQLTLALQTQDIFNPDETVALSMAADHHGNLYVGTGHQGKIFEVDRQRRGHLLFQAAEPEILALAVGPDGDLYAGSSPEGKIYRITPQGASSIFYNPKARYIWALAFDAQGRLYVGTGDHGQIFRVDRNGEGKMFFASNQTHIMCLAFDRDGNVLAGSDPGGLVYRITPQGKAFVLYQANLPEIHALATDAEGRIYAAALGNAVPSAVPGYFSTPQMPSLVSAPAQSVTVVASAGDAARDPGMTQKQRKAPPQQPAPSANPNVSAGIGSPFKSFALGRGELIEISPDYTAQTLWTSNKEGIFGLSTRGQDVIFSTDADGRIYDLHTSPDGPRLTLLSETRESLPTRILTEGQNLFVATSNVAKLIQIGTTIGTEGAYESPVKDARFISRWGHLFWRAAAPPGCSLEFYVRSGNSARPDNTWSDWSGPYRNPEGSAISSIPARYVQWKAVFHGSDGKSPELREVTLSYLNQNLPPEIRSFSISQGDQKTTLTGTPIVSASPGVSFAPAGTVAVSQFESPVYDSPPPEQTAPPAKPPIVFSWQANDPNGDHLSYGLYLKSTDEQQWHLLKGKLKDSSFTLQPSSLANGEYQAKLTASDAPSNPPDQALKTELVSAPFWVDNTVPEISVLSKTLDGTSAMIRFEAVSQVAPLRNAEVSVGENNWREIISDGGIVDLQKESFTVKLSGLKSGEHVVSLRATDTAGNVGIGKAVIRVQ